MNRRSFLGDMLKLGIGAMVLPGAGRKWVTSAAGIRYVEPKLIVPFWSQTICDTRFYDQEYLKYLEQTLVLPADVVNMKPRRSNWDGVLEILAKDKSKPPDMFL